MENEVSELKFNGEIFKIADDNARNSISNLSEVATTGSYEDLINKPTIPTTVAELSDSSDYITNNDLSEVATTGSYEDLINKPTISNSSVTIKINGQNIDGGSFTLNQSSNKIINIIIPTKVTDLEDANNYYKKTDFNPDDITVDLTGYVKEEYLNENYTKTIDLNNTYVLRSELKTVATTGNYNDLTGRPTIGNATITINHGGNSDTFTLNQTSNKTINISTTVDQTYSATSTNAQSGVAVKSAIDNAITAVYKPAGTKTFSGLPTPSASNLGNVYNVSDAFTIDNRFVEYSSSTTKTYPAGTNVVIVKISSDYKFDVLSGFVDLSGYQTKITSSNKIAASNISGLATVATSGSYNDLNNKPTIPDAQVQSDWNVTNTSSKAFIKNKPTIPTKISQLEDDVFSVKDSKPSTMTSGVFYFITE